MAKIFVSYRIDDTRAIAGRIVAQLQQSFGEDAVIFDAEDVPLGINIRKHLASVVGQCGVLLALVGKSWLAAADEGQTSLQDPSDFQRVAIESALSAGVPVVPVFVDKVPRPRERELPVSLAEFAFLTGVAIDSGIGFDTQMERLIKGLESHVHTPARRPEAPAAPVAPVRVEEDREALAAKRKLALQQAEQEIRQKTQHIVQARTAQE